MCGIIGGNWFTSIKQTKDHLQKIIHRGRDASIVDVIDDIYVGHNRLSIQDLSSTANQPMWNEDKTVCIVYNGELWDSVETKELKSSLKTKFKTKSDTEIILNAYCEFGTK
jgi:asparagine synthase (glutamine-hydrolysing)